MTTPNIYNLFAKIDNILFLIETQLKTAENNAQKADETTNKIQQITLDCYMSHPSNTQGLKAGRWSNYSDLADRLEKIMEKHTVTKGLHARSCEDLRKTAQLLTDIKIAISSSQIF